MLLAWCLKALMFSLVMPINNKPHPTSQLDIEFVDDTFLQTYNLSYTWAFFVNLAVDRVDPLRIYDVNLLIRLS